MTVEKFAVPLSTPKYDIRIVSLYKGKDTGPFTWLQDTRQHVFERQFKRPLEEAEFTLSYQRNLWKYVQRLVDGVVDAVGTEPESTVDAILSPPSDHPDQAIPYREALSKKFPKACDLTENFSRKGADRAQHDATVETIKRNLTYSPTGHEEKIRSLLVVDDILNAEATANIEDLYFRLPIDGGEAVFRERVYCYELYHQLRLRWLPQCSFVLNGEVDKRAHPILRQRGVEFAVPDFLVHTPGDMHGNHAIIEVKSAEASSSGIGKDLATLTRFRNVVGYDRAIYLFYGGIRMERVKRIAGLVPSLPRIEVWVHEAPRSAARRVAILGS